MSSVFDPKLSMEAVSRHNMIEQKQKIDSLKNRLGDNKTDAESLRESCEGFEAIFIQKMWEQMRQNVPKNGYLQSKDEEMYQSMFDVELSKKMASAGGIGLADMLYEQLSQNLVNRSKTTKSSTPRPPIVPPSSAEVLAEKNMKESAQIGPPKGLLMTADNLYTDLETEVSVPEKKEASLIEKALADLEENLGKEILVEQDRPLRADKSPAKFPAPNTAPEDLIAGSWHNPRNISAKPRPISKFDKASPLKKNTELKATASSNYPSFLPNEPHWPLAGRINDPFGWQDDQSTGQREWHPGVGIESRSGANVQACMSGTISFSGPSEGYENLVVIDHGDNYKTYYGNARLSGFVPGDTVDGGMVFASVTPDNKALNDGENISSLYFSLKRGEMALNPEATIPRTS